MMATSYSTDESLRASYMYINSNVSISEGDSRCAETVAYTFCITLRGEDYGVTTCSSVIQYIATCYVLDVSVTANDELYYSSAEAYSVVIVEDCVVNVSDYMWQVAGVDTRTGTDEHVSRGIASV